jgi:hypothetical protein
MNVILRWYDSSGERSPETTNGSVPTLNPALAPGHRSIIDTSRSGGIRNSDGPADIPDQVPNSHHCFA